MWILQNKPLTTYHRRAAILTFWGWAGFLAKDFTIDVWVFPAQLFEVQVNVFRAFGPQNAQKTT